MSADIPLISREEVFAGFDQANAEVTETLIITEAEHAALEAKTARDTNCLLALCGEDVGSHPADQRGQALPSQEVTLARTYAGADRELFEQSVIAVVGALLLVFCVTISAGVEFALFFGLYAADMSDRFGELTEGSYGIVFLLALQALVVLVVVKLFITTPGRKAAMLGFAFLGSVFFLGGAVVHRGLAAIDAQSGTEAVGLSWGSAADVAGSLPSFFPELETASFFLLALPFLITPIAAALLLSWGWTAFTSGLSRALIAIRFKRNFDERNQGLANLEGLGRRIRALRQGMPLQVMAPVRKTVVAKLEAAHDLRHRAGNSRLSKIGQLAVTSLPGSATAPLIDAEEAERMANQVILTLGNGFVERCYADWCAMRAGAPKLS